MGCPATGAPEGKLTQTGEYAKLWRVALSYILLLLEPDHAEGHEQSLAMILTGISR